MAKATVYLRRTVAGQHVKIDVPNGEKVMNRDGVLVVVNATGTEDYFAAPLEIVDHVEITRGSAD